MTLEMIGAIVLYLALPALAVAPLLSQYVVNRFEDARGALRRASLALDRLNAPGAAEAARYAADHSVGQQHLIPQLSRNLGRIAHLIATQRLDPDRASLVLEAAIPRTGTDHPLRTLLRHTRRLIDEDTRLHTGATSTRNLPQSSTAPATELPKAVTENPSTTSTDLPIATTG